MRPALIDATTDTRLKGAPKEVLFYLHTILDPGEFRPLKLWPIAQVLHLEKATVGRAMKRLVDCGYIRCGPREKPGGRSYLLLTTRGETLKAPSGAKIAAHIDRFRFVGRDGSLLSEKE